jgi:hypothetical protein
MSGITDVELELVDRQHLFVVLAICSSHFRIPALGLQKIRDAISRVTATNSESLPPGQKSLVASLASTEAGLPLLGICGAVHQYFGEERFLGPFLQCISTLERDNSPQDDYDWQILVPVFANILSSSDFPALLDSMKQMLRDRPNGSETLVRALPDLIVDGLQGLVRQSEGEATKILMFMGADAALVTAFADWLFDLDVELRDQKGVKVGAWTEKPFEDAQITVYMQNPGVPCAQ